MLSDLSLFFFSSRRRHTRCALVTGVQTCALPIYRTWKVEFVNSMLCLLIWKIPGRAEPILDPFRACGLFLSFAICEANIPMLANSACKFEIGRASCRERVCQYV